MLEDVKNCPYCGEEILAVAKKCKHCGEWLNVNASADLNSVIEKPVMENNSEQGQTIIINQVERRSNGVGTAGFVLALIALFLSWIPVIGWIMWFLGLILSFIGLFKKPRGLSIAGFLISIIKLIVIILLISVLGFGITKDVLKTKEYKKAAVEVQNILENQKNDLEKDLIDLKVEFGSLEINNDSIKTLASQQQERITKLLAMQANNAYKIKTYQNELETLREVLKTYKTHPR